MDMPSAMPVHLQADLVEPGEAVQRHAQDWRADHRGAPWRGGGGGGWRVGARRPAPTGREAGAEAGEAAGGEGLLQPDEGADEAAEVGP